MEEENKVILKCIKEGSRLRVRILNQGYYNNANCQFPKNIRLEGRYYKVSPKYITLITRTNKYFYNVKNVNIEILDNYDENNVNMMDKAFFENITIYEDSDNNECCICLDSQKDSVFIPCGHYYCCMNCAHRIEKCPICRSSISNFINKELFG